MFIRAGLLTVSNIMEIPVLQSMNRNNNITPLKGPILPKLYWPGKLYDKYNKYTVQSSPPPCHRFDLELHVS